MPIQDPFNALGRGNGFPFCISELAVDDYHDYVTLSGHRKGDGTPTPESINDSFVAAMQLYWNSNQLSGSSLANSLEYYASVDDVILEKSPPERVCGPSLNINEDSNSDDQPPFGGAFAEITLESSLMVRMTVGGNLIGYGINPSYVIPSNAGFANASANAELGGPNLKASVFWISGVSSSAYDDLVRDKEDVSLTSDFSIQPHSISIGTNENDEEIFSTILTVSYASVNSVSISDNPVANVQLNAASASGFDGAIASASLLGLDFWTYEDEL